MKKILSLIFLPIVAIMCLCGCGNEGNVDELKKLYTDVKNVYVVDEENIFFSDLTSPNTITISYPAAVQEAIDIEFPNTELQKRYRTFYYEQLLLDTIFNFYEDNADNFYLVMSSAEYKEKDVEKLYEKLNNLKTCLVDFKTSYNIFIEQTQEGLSDVLDINLKNYTFELNKVVERSFDFMYEFVRVYEKYCVTDSNSIDEKTLNYRIDKAYLDIAHIVYLENFKTFSTAVVDRGVCDLSKLIGNDSDFNLLNDLGEIKELSNNVLVNLDTSSEQYLSAMEVVNSFIYASNMFDQEYAHYVNTYNDVYSSENNTTNQYNNYRFDLMGGGSLESFLNGLSVTDRSKVNLLTDFINVCYTNLVDKLNLIVE